MKKGNMMRQKINLTVATDIEGMGGIASVLNTYRYCGFLQRNNVRLIATHSTRYQAKSLAAVGLYLWALLRVTGYLMFYQVGVVHIHVSARGSYSRKALMVRLVKRMGGRVILHLHSGGFRDFYEKQCNADKQAHIRKTFEMADIVIAISSQWAAWLQKLLGRSEHVRLLYNSTAEIKADRTNAVPENIVFMGKLCQLKGVEDLIQAYSRVREVYPQARLKLAGNGPAERYQEYARQLSVDDGVEFLGWVSGEGKNRLLESAGVYCLPSYHEGFPNGVIEAMCCGIPVVSTQVGGIPDAIGHGEHGLLVAPGDVQALTDALLTALLCQPTRNRMVASARKKFERAFHLDAVIPQLELIYQEAAGDKQG